MTHYVNDGPQAQLLVALQDGKSLQDQFNRLVLRASRSQDDVDLCRRVLVEDIVIHEDESSRL